jgi:DME family drug/metabolite transporter
VGFVTRSEQVLVSSAAADRRRGVLLVASAGVLWSTLGLGVRLMEDASAWQIVFYRGIFQAGFVALLVVYRSRGRLAEPLRDIGWPGIFGALGLAIAYNAMIVALTLTSVATVAFVLSTAPLAAGLLGWLVLGERVRPVTFVAMGLAASGMLVMGAGQLDGERLAGMFLAGLAVLGYSVFTVSLRKGASVDMLPTLALSGLLAALMSSLAIDSFAMTGRDLVLSGYLGSVSLGVGLAMFTAGSRHLSAAELPLIAMTESVLAPLWVWVALGESVTGATLIGGAIVLGSVLLQAFLASRGGGMADP